jgi:hypothetical protein
MNTTNTMRPYAEVHDLLAQHGGSMTWHPTGRGGEWRLYLQGRSFAVPCHDRSANSLDDLYVPKTSTPKTWDDYDNPAPLRDDAFWGLVSLFKQSAPIDSKGA